MARNYTASDLALISARLKNNQPLEGLELSKPRRRNNEESRTQQALCEWWRYACKGYGLPEIALMAIPMQGWRTIVNATRMKKEGARRGTWDLQLTVARGGFHSLWIEMKATGGKLTPDQIAFGYHLTAQGFCVDVCWTLDAAVKRIVTYLAS